MLRPIFPLTEENIYYKTNDYSIFRYYCSKFTKIGKHFNSPLRNDPDPSAVISAYKGRLIFRDFGLKLSLYPIQFVMAQYNINYNNALQKINSDLHLGLKGDSTKKYKKFHFDVDLSNYSDNKTIIKIANSKFSSEDLNYWNKFSWTYDMLEKAKVRNINAFWIYKDNKYFFDTKYKQSYSYDYYWHNGVFLRKIYMPYEQNRFFTNADQTVIQGWDLLPKEGGDNLFITSSFKDMGPFWRLNKYCNAIAPNSEAAFIPEDIFYTKIKPRWNNIYIWLDNDITGIRNALKWSQKYKIKSLWNPLSAPKDPSDFVAKHGLREFNYLKNNLLR